MTQKLFLEDAYSVKSRSTIIASGPGWFHVDTTIFYARSGGQPGDQGQVFVNGKCFEIVDSHYETDRKTVKHLLSNTESVLLVGQEVSFELNWERRHRLMRMHTSMHLLCSLIPAPVTGGGVGENESRVEFDIQTTDFDKELLSNQLNELIQQCLPIEISAITDQQLDDQPELVRTMSVQPPRGLGSIRMVNIGDGIDYQPCGGTHVKNTSEIGLVKVMSIKSKGRQNKRFTIALS